MLRYAIELTVFICGAVLMALEIIGGRLLTPYYGSTVYVWGSIIGIILLSLSSGYYLGGKLADKKPKAHFLSLLILMAAALIALIPFIYFPIIKMFSGLPRMYSPLFAATFLFFLPSLLIGTVSPFAIRLRAKDVGKIGKLSGNLYALSTIGSVIGTFSATFVLILTLSLPNIFFLLSSILFVTAGLLSKRSVMFSAAGILAILLFMSMGVSNPTYYGSDSDSSNQANFSTPVNVNIDSLYGLLTVKDAKGNRGLYINNGIMSEMVIDNELATAQGWQYLDCFEIGYLMNPQIDDVLVLGLGTGIGSRKLAAKYGSDIDTVEINDGVFGLARRYFNFSTSDKMKTYIDDARVFLDDTDKNYDLIISDVVHFDPAAGYEIPVHLTTQEFFGLVKEHLKPGGIFIVNIPVAPNSAFLKSEYKTIGTVFDNAYIFNCATQVIVASKDRAYDTSQLKGIAPNLDRFLSTVSSPSLNDSYPVYTDAFTPVY